MANPEHLAILKQGVEVWNEWREEHPEVRPNLSGADLDGTTLRAANLTSANLRGATLRGAKLSGAFLREADLGGADLRRADLSRAYLNEADLSGTVPREANLGGAFLPNADLREADLSRTVLREAYLSQADLGEANLCEADLLAANLHGAILRRANLAGADVTEAHLGSTIFANTDFSGTRGLELCRHEGPSSIGLDTFYRTKGAIPEVFLRGCGVPDDMIAYVRSIAGAYSFTPASSAIRPKTKSLPTGCMPTCRPRACAAGLRRTTSGAGGRFMSRLTKPFACMTSCC